MNLYRNIGIVLIVLSAFAVLLAIVSFPYTDDYFYVGVAGLFILLASIYIYRAGKDYGANKRMNKKPFWLIIISFAIAFLLPIIYTLLAMTRISISFGDGVTGAFILFLFITGPIGAILFLIGVILLFLQSRKK